MSDIAVETILFVLATALAVAIWVAICIFAIARDGRRRDDAYEADTRYWMAKPKGRR